MMPYSGRILRIRSMLNFLVMLALVVSCSEGRERAGSERPETAAATRVISLSPSTTEIMFEVGAGGHLVGVTRFCSLPTGRRGVERVGGYLDPSYEKIVSLRPDLVIVLPEQDEVARFLDRLGIVTLTVDNKTVSDIMDAISVIGSRFDKALKADSLLASMRTRIERVERSSAGRRRAKVLISIGHDFGSGRAREVYVAGEGTYYDELVKTAGGENVCGEGMAEFPVISSEGILSLDPEIIIELVQSGVAAGMSNEDIVSEWDHLSSVRAVRNGRVHVVRNDYSHIPGPRFILLLEEIADIVQGEREWKK